MTRIETTAQTLGFQALTLNGGPFRLAAFYKSGRRPETPLTVFLEGDGSPWVGRYRVADDPTPRTPVMLELMGLDEGPALYLGRPCYLGHADDPACNPLLWTHRRYAPEIVAAMAEALRGFLRDRRFTGLRFIGHSGGGTLAMLLAPRFPQTRVVVTLAANLDVPAWAEIHGYSPLEGSLSAVDVPSGAFAEIHFLGERDVSVPPRLMRPRLDRRAGAVVHVLPDADHHCCWASAWPQIALALATTLPGAVKAGPETPAPSSAGN